MEGRCIRFAKVMAAFLAAVMATGSLAGCGGGEPAGQAEASVEYEDKTYGGAILRPAHRLGLERRARRMDGVQRS